MENNIQIKQKKYLGDNRYIDDTITLYCESGISPWGREPFLWAGNYEGDKIKVKLERNTSEHLAEIIKPKHLNISDQIIEEIRRILRQIN